MNRTITVRLTDVEVRKLDSLRQGRSVTETVRELIISHAEEEKNQPAEFLKTLDKIWAATDFLTVKIRDLEGIEAALVQILGLMKAAAERQPAGSGEDTKKIANILWSLSQLNNQYGWNNFPQEQKTWITSTIKGGGEKR